MQILERVLDGLTKTVEAIIKIIEGTLETTLRVLEKIVQFAFRLTGHLLRLLVVIFPGLAALSYGEEVKLGGLSFFGWACIVLVGLVALSEALRSLVQSITGSSQQLAEPREVQSTEELSKSGGQGESVKAKKPAPVSGSPHGYLFHWILVIDLAILFYLFWYVSGHTPSRTYLLREVDALRHMLLWFIPRPSPGQ